MSPLASLVRWQASAKATALLLLVGGVLLSAPGCRGKNGMISIFPSRVADRPAEDTRNPEIRIGQPAGAEAATPSDAAPPALADLQGVDPETGLTREMRTAGDELPAGEPLPELPPVAFDFDSDRINPEAHAALLRAATHLKANPALRVVLRGHTDAQGTDEYNLALGSKRAMAVREFLIGQGIAAERLETVSFGEYLPFDEADSDEARARNRRVEFFAYTVD
jgi:peptidoglycan-associated lipoprotein